MSYSVTVERETDGETSQVLRVVTGDIPRIYLLGAVVTIYPGAWHKAALHTGALGKPGWRHGTAYCGPVKVSW